MKEPATRGGFGLRRSRRNTSCSSSSQSDMLETITEGQADVWAHPSGQRCMKVWSPVMPQNEETSPARIGQFTKIGEFTCCFSVHNNFLAVSFPVSKARGYKPHKGYQASKRAERSASRNGASYLGFSWAKAPVAKHTSQAPKGNRHTPIFPLGGQTPDGRLSLLKLAPFGQLVSSLRRCCCCWPGCHGSCWRGSGAPCAVECDS